MRFRTVAGLILAGYLLGVAREFRQTGRLLAWRFTEPELAALNGGAPQPSRRAAEAPPPPPSRRPLAATAAAPSPPSPQSSPSPPPPPREKRAARCTPGCEPWCVPKFALAHCAACKCSGCAFCAEGGAEDDAPPPDDDAPSSAQRRRPPPPPRLERPPPIRGLERPSSQCLRPRASSEDDDEGEEDGAWEPLSYDVLALVLSSRQAELEPWRRRQAVRHAWAHPNGSLGAPGAPPERRCSMRLLFVMGGAAAPTLHAREQLLLPVEDGYRQIAQKVVGAFAWAAAHVAFKYVLKTDDDSFVCVARLVERLHYAPRRGFYLGVVNAHHRVIQGATDPSYARWNDDAYVSLFNRTTYAPYMQGAGYVLSADMAALVAARAAALPTLPAVEDALVGTLLEDSATLVNVPSAIRHKNRGEFAVTVCEVDTEFVLVHKLSIDELRRCRLATRQRRSERCPRGPCVCATLGQTLKRKRTLVRSFEAAEEIAAERAAQD